MPGLAPRIAPDFKERVTSLVEKGKELTRSLKDAKLALLDFCRDYFQVYNQAKTPAAKHYLAEQTGLTESTVRNTYKSIGEQYGVLKKHIALLPPSQEGMKALAKAEKRQPGAIERLKAKSVLTPDAEPSVSEIRSGIRKFIPDKSRKTTRVIDVSSDDDTAEYVIRLICKKQAVVVSAIVQMLRNSDAIALEITDVPLQEEIKAGLGKAWLRANGARLVQR